MINLDFPSASALVPYACLAFAFVLIAFFQSLSKLRDEVLTMKGSPKPKTPIFGDILESIVPVNKPAAVIGETTSGAPTDVAVPLNVVDNTAVVEPTAEMIVKPKRKRTPRKPKIAPEEAALQANSLARAEMESRLAAELVENGDTV